MKSVKKEICNGYNPESCDKSCVSNEDCEKADDCSCYNIKDTQKLRYTKDGEGILWESCGPIKPNCKCLNKICTNV